MRYTESSNKTDSIFDMLRNLVSVLFLSVFRLSWAITTKLFYIQDYNLIKSMINKSIIINCSLIILNLLYSYYSTGISLLKGSVPLVVLIIPLVLICVLRAGFNIFQQPKLKTIKGSVSKSKKLDEQIVIEDTKEDINEIYNKHTDSDIAVPSIKIDEDKPVVKSEKVDLNSLSYDDRLIESLESISEDDIFDTKEELFANAENLDFSSWGEEDDDFKFDESEDDFKLHEEDLNEVKNNPVYKLEDAIKENTDEKLNLKEEKELEELETVGELAESSWGQFQDWEEYEDEPADF